MQPPNSNELIAHLYYDSNSKYFTGARSAWIDQLPDSKNAKILEVGCANGDTGAYAKAKNKCVYFAGIELVEDVAENARVKLDEVICGNVENLEFHWPKHYFDVLLMSEVLEHLVDPWATLARLYPLLSPGGLVFASSPNVSHYSIISMLIRGNWDLSNCGIMDKTHLRWFTPTSYRAMFEYAGFKIEKLAPVAEPGVKSKIINTLTAGKLKHLFWRQIDLIAVKL